MSTIDTYTAAIERALATTRLGRARINAIVGEQRDLLEELASDGASLCDELGTPRDYAASVAREYEGVGYDDHGRRTTPFGALFASSRRRIFDPEDEKILQPHLMGLGWSINWGAVAVKAGWLRPDDLDATTLANTPAAARVAAWLTPVALTAGAVTVARRAGASGVGPALALAASMALPIASLKHRDVRDELAGISLATLLSAAGLARAVSETPRAGGRLQAAAVFAAGFALSGAVVVVPLVAATRG